MVIKRRSKQDKYIDHAQKLESIEFFQANVFHIETSILYDRIFVNAIVSPGDEDSLLNLLNIGGILLYPKIDEDVKDMVWISVIID